MLENHEQNIVKNEFYEGQGHISSVEGLPREDFVKMDISRKDPVMVEFKLVGDIE